MNKSILIIDTPYNCRECPCFYDYLRCQAKENVNVLGEKRPKNCPLKPLPKLEKIEKRDLFISSTWQIIGWNNCLRNILGEENDE